MTSRRNFIWSAFASLFGFGTTAKAHEPTESDCILASGIQCTGGGYDSGLTLSGDSNDCGHSLGDGDHVSGVGDHYIHYHSKTPTIKITLTMPSGQVVVLDEMPEDIVIDYPDHLSPADRKDKSVRPRAYSLSGEPLLFDKQLHFGPLKITSKAPSTITGTQETTSGLTIIGNCPDGCSNGISFYAFPGPHGLKVQEK